MGTNSGQHPYKQYHQRMVDGLTALPKGVEYYGYLESRKWDYYRALGCRAAHPLVDALTVLVDWRTIQQYKHLFLKRNIEV